MPKTFATALYRDIYAGTVAASLVPFKTQRRGEAVTRYRWLRANGQAAGGFVSGGFSSVEAGLAAANRHAGFFSVAAVPAGWDVAETSVEA